MRQKGIVHLFLLIVVVVVTIGAVGYYAYQNAQLKEQVEEMAATPENTNPTNLLIQDNEFINTKYNYKVTYSDIYEISTPNPEGSETVNFRKKDDDIPAESGISITVLESTASLKDACGTPFLENQGILCNKNNFRFTLLQDSLPWEVYEKDIVGIIPSGYVHASLFRKNYVYLINNYGYKTIEADVFVDNFKFIK
jgi:uncharacterized protein (UPF0333 family)